MNDFRHKAARSPVIAHRSHFIGLNITKDRPPRTSEDVYRPFVPNRCSKWNFRGQVCSMCSLLSWVFHQENWFWCVKCKRALLHCSVSRGGRERLIEKASQVTSHGLLTMLINDKTIISHYWIVLCDIFDCAVLASWWPTACRCVCAQTKQKHTM